MDELSSHVSPYKLAQTYETFSDITRSLASVTRVKLMNPTRHYAKVNECVSPKHRKDLSRRGRAIKPRCAWERQAGLSRCKVGNRIWEGTWVYFTIDINKVLIALCPNWNIKHESGIAISEKYSIILGQWISFMVFFRWSNIFLLSPKWWITYIQTIILRRGYFIF